MQQAAELRPDLIAMATHGHGWAKRIVLGSVADHVRHNTDVPLLLLKGGPGAEPPHSRDSASSREYAAVRCVEH